MTTQVPSGSIVVGVDGSPASARALDWAVDQADLEQRPLVIAHAEESSVIAQGAGSASSLGDALTRARALSPNLVIHPVRSFDDARTALLSFAHDAHLLVVGARGRGPIPGLLLGSVSTAVYQLAPCTVAIVRLDMPAENRGGILVGVDETEQGVAALEFAYRMASYRRRPLTLLHASWDIGLGTAAYAADHQHAEADVQLQQQAWVAEAAAGLQEKFPDVHVEVELGHGSADRALLESSRDFELLVVGFQQLGWREDLSYGSLSPSIIQHARCAVAVVRAGVAEVPDVTRRIGGGSGMVARG